MSPSRAPLACPRCFYDLSSDPGATAAPAEARAVCAECGLGLLWMDVRDPYRVVKKWSFEHHARGWRSAAAFFGTALRVSVPWVFWKHFSVETPIVLGRAARWALVLLAVPFLAGHLIYAATIVIARALGGVLVGATIWSTHVDDVKDVLYSPLIYPVGDWVGPAAPRGVFTLGNELWIFGPTNCNLGVWAFILAVGLHPALLALLPETRSRARVRGSHILRALWYSLAALSIYPLSHLAFALLNVPWDWLGPGSARVGTSLVSPRDLAWDFAFWLTLARPFSVVWLSIWWTFAAKSWRLTNPREVYAVIWIVGLLGAMIVLVVGQIF